MVGNAAHTGVAKTADITTTMNHRIALHEKRLSPLAFLLLCLFSTNTTDFLLNNANAVFYFLYHLNLYLFYPIVSV